MTTIILEPDQRAICRSLRRISTIWELHEAFHDPWANYLKILLSSTRKLYTTDSENLAIKPDFIVHLGIPGMKTPAAGLLKSIRKLKESDDFEEKDLYARLDRLDIASISTADIKGLYLLVAYTAEKKKVFDENK